MIDNWYFFVRFVTTFICFCVFFLYLFPKQFREVYRPRDWLTGLRKLILWILILIIITLVPPLAYQFMLAVGVESPGLRNISSLVGGVNLAGLTLLFYLVFTYRRKD